MKAPGIPSNEKERLQALKEYSILDSLPEEEFDDITRIASAICKTPISTITLIDSDRQWFKSNRGLPNNGGPREFAFCAHAINFPDKVYTVTDSRKDERFFDNPLVVGEPYVIFYKGVPLVSPEGFALGTLCVIDNKPRELDEEADACLKALANQVVKLLELKRLNSAVSVAEKQYREIVNDVNDMIYELDSEGRFKFVNVNVIKRLGYPESEIIGKIYTTAIHPDDRVSVTEFYSNQLKRREPLSYLELRLLTKDGSDLWIGQNVRMVFEAGWAVKVVAIARDITELREAQAKLAEAKERAEEATRTKSRFLGMMSHEIRTPLNGIMGITHILTENNPRVDQLENLDLLRFSCENLLTIINDILDFNKVEAGKMELECITFNLAEIIAQHIKMLSVRANQKRIELKLNLDSKIPKQLVGDPVRLGQILNNLIGNAIKFTESGSVEISITETTKTNKSHRIKFSVRDTGIGIPENKIEDIFSGFTQASADTTRKFGGTGLGLSITKRLLELMGSSIEVKSKIGEGSEFNFEITFHESEGAIRSSPGKRISPSTEARSVLVIDDNKVNQIVATNYLITLGHKVKAANTGDEGIDMLAMQKFDLILMDLQMPKKNGYETAIEIRRTPGKYFAEVPIIALTADILPEVKLKVSQAGMNGYLHKPFLLHELEEIISKHGRQQIVKEKSQALSNIKAISEGDETYTKELTQHIIDNLFELRNSYRKTIELKSPQHFEDALHKSKTALYIVKQEELDSVSEKIRAALVNQNYSEGQLLKSEFETVLDKIIGGLMSTSNS